MRERQFTTDSYRMFGALNRMCQSPISWYNSGPTLKYMLRQIRTMDFSLVDETAKKKWATEKPSYTARDGSKLLINKDMDIALLMLYGHILHTGASYNAALSKSSIIFDICTHHLLMIFRLLLPRLCAGP
jgi:general transcription factor 3C polypeptide 3 (transcription factor C subunit 4)